MSPQTANGFTITVRATPRAPSALVCLSGEIDMAAFVALSGVVDRLSTVAATHVVVDLAGVTFACSTLSNFLAGLHKCLPPGSTLSLCRPTTHIRGVLQMTGMDKIATLRADLPH